jgi:hypothetical protein
VGLRAPLRFAFQAAFLVLVGVALAAADVGLLPFVVVMAVVWVLVAAAERTLSRPRVATSPLAGRASSREEALLPVHQPRAREATLEQLPVPQPQRRLEAVPRTEPEPEPEPEPREEQREEADELVLELPRAAHRRPEGWNLWDLELTASERAGENQLRDEEWHALFVSLREYAEPDGTLPSEFDALVQDSFAELISTRP